MFGQISIKYILCFPDVPATIDKIQQAATVTVDQLWSKSGYWYMNHTTFKGQDFHPGRMV